MSIRLDTYTPTPRYCPTCGLDAKTIHVDRYSDNLTDRYAVCEQGHRWQITEITRERTGR